MSVLDAGRKEILKTEYVTSTEISIHTQHYVYPSAQNDDDLKIDQYHPKAVRFLDLLFLRCEDIARKFLVKSAGQSTTELAANS